MSNFFYRYSDYSVFQKAFNELDGEDVVVDLLSSDPSLKENEVIEKKHIMRRDNRFDQESSFNKFFGPRKSLNRNFDMKDFSSWKNKNYRETEKEIGKIGGDKPKFSFSDFMNERSGNKTYNDADENRNTNQKAINELSTEDTDFKRFSLNDYMRRLEEKTRVNQETRDDEDLIDSIGDLTQEVTPDSSQDENFDESVSINVEKFVDDEDFRGDRYSVDSSELDAMKSRLTEIKEQTKDINGMLEDIEDTQESDVEINESSQDELGEEQIDEQNEQLEDDEEKTDADVVNFDETEETSNEEDDLEEDKNIDDSNDVNENNQKNENGQNIKIITGTSGENKVESGDENNSQAGTQVGGKVQVNSQEGSQVSVGNGGSQNGSNESVKGDTQSSGRIVGSHGGEGGGETNVIQERPVIILQGNEQTNQKSEPVLTDKQEQKSQEIITLINKNDKERKEIEEKLRQAEKDKLQAMQSYEGRLKELQKSIIIKDKEHQEQTLQEKIKNDNKLSEMRAVYESREQEIRRLEKESALKLKIGALLKKELKNNLSISNLEMNNKLLEITSLINQEKEKAKAKKKTTRKRTTKRKIDSDIIGGIDFD